MTQLPLIHTDVHLVKQVEIMAKMREDGRISYQQYRAFIRHVAELLQHRSMQHD